MNPFHRTARRATTALGACLALGLAAASPDTRAAETQELRYQGWVGQVTYPELAEDLGYLAPVKLKWIGNTISGPQDIQTVVTGDIDFGGAFNGAVAKLIAAKAPVKAVIGFYGVDANTYSGYYVAADSPIKTARDLIGKKVAVNTLGAHHELMLREYLARAGLTPAEARQVTLVVVPPVNGEQALRQGRVDATTLGGVLRDKALERGGLRRLFSDLDLFGNFTAGTYVVHTRFLKENPTTTRQFVAATARAIEWARTTPPDQVRARFEKIIAQRKRNEDASTVRYWKSTGVAGAGGVIADAELQQWIDWLVKDGLLRPDQVRAADLYTNEFNPYATPRARQAAVPASAIGTQLRPAGTAATHAVAAR